MDVEPDPVYANTEEVDTVSTDATGETSDATAFRLPNGVDRIWLVTGRSHFDDNVGVVVDRNEIKLSVVDLNVGANNIEAVVCQEPGSQFLTKLPQLPTRVFWWC
jgi:hypothetical protein